MKADIPSAISRRYQFVDKIPHNILRFHNSSVAENCKCGYCFKVIDSPLIIKNCEHGVCRQCLLRNVVGKNYDETCCPKCGSNFRKFGISPSSLLQTLIDNLRIPCPVGCDSIVTFACYMTHKSHCSPRNASTGNNIVGDGLRALLMQSDSDTIEIKTGGQVSVTLLFTVTPGKDVLVLLFYVIIICLERIYFFIANAIHQVYETKERSR